MILSIVNKAVSNFFHFSAENSYLFGFHKIIALAELIGTATLKNDGLMSKSGFLSAIGLNLEGYANNVNNGVYKFDSQQDNMPVNYGILVAFSCDGWIRMQLCAGGDNGLAYIRMHYNSWTSWKMETTIILISEENTSARQKIHSQSYTHLIWWKLVPMEKNNAIKDFR